MSDQPAGPPDPRSVPVSQPGPPLPPAPPAQGGMEPPVEVPLPIPTPVPAPRRRRPWLLVGALVLAVVAIVALIRPDGAGLPDRLSGQSRVTDGPGAASLDAFEEMTVGDMTIEMALYGPSLNPAYLVMAFEGDIPGSDEGLLASLPAGMISDADAQIDFARQITAVFDGTEIVCAPATNTSVGMEVAMCIYAGDDRGGVVMGLVSTDLNRLMATTQELLGELG